MTSTYQQHVDQRIREMRHRLLHFQKRKRKEKIDKKKIKYQRSEPRLLIHKS